MLNYYLLKVGFSHALRHRLQTVLLITGIAFGVALVVAVDLVNGSAKKSLRDSADIFTAAADFRIRGAPSGFDESVYVRLKTDPDNTTLIPYVSDFINIVEIGDRPVRLVGIDPLASLGNDSGPADTTRFLPRGVLNDIISEPGTALISPNLANKTGMTVPGNLRYFYGSSAGELRIIGVIDSAGVSGITGSEGVILTDISTAQETLGKIGLLTQIDVIPEGNPESRDKTIREISGRLPPGVEILPVESLRESAASMTRAFELNLLALSLLALFVGLFLIYNTVTFSVLQRRAVFGTLRSIGVTPREILKMVIVETLALGIIGSVIGLVLGIALGNGLLGLVTGTVSNLYYTLTSSGYHLSALTLLKGFTLGIAASVAAGLVPAIEASGVRPVGALRRSEFEGYLQKHIPALSLAGTVIIFMALLILRIPSDNILISLGSLFMVLTGGSMLVPLITKIFMSFLSAVTRGFPPALRMAPANVVRSLSRTAVAIASLTVAVSVLISVAVMIGSFRATVVNWLDYTLNADVFVSLDTYNVGSTAGLEPGIIDEVLNAPGVDRVATGRNVLIESPRYGTVNLLAVTEDIGAKNRKFVWKRDVNRDMWEMLADGSVLVSESFANLNGMDSGDTGSLTLNTDYGEKPFEIAGIYYDYGYQRGVILMADPVYRKYWRDGLISSLSVYGSQGTASDILLAGIRSELTDYDNLVIRSNKGLRERALGTFDRTFEITRTLRVLVAVVAFMAVFSSLMSLQLERARECGILKSLGMTSVSLTGMTLAENLYIGMTAAVLSVPLGLVLSMILIGEVNLRSFGWTLDFTLMPSDVLQAVMISVAAALCAGIYPAWRIGSQKASDLLREE